MKRILSLKERKSLKTEKDQKISHLKNLKKISFKELNLFYNV